MALFAIADPHLSLSVNKPMDVFSGWDDYVSRLEKNWCALVTEEDTVVLAGDISWGMSLAESAADFAFLDRLPGRKLIFKGNHDYWWSTRRQIDKFFEENGFSTLRVVHNDAVAVEHIAVCGSRGWFFDAGEADKKVILREAGRLRTSIEAAKATGLPPVVFLHYPPLYGEQKCDEIWQVLKDEGVTRVYYGHLHGAGIRGAVTGEVEGIHLTLISGDSLQFTPLLIPQDAEY